tara:strand:+ start:797 stop:1717 length:921 start_codon:yes stop_codon:yes gene_type:complete
MKHIKNGNLSMFTTEGSIFMGAKREITNCDIGIFGVPYDGTTSFRGGARFGPSAIREVSNGLETYCPQLNLDLKEINFTDLGSLEIPFGAPEPVLALVAKGTEYILSKKIKPLMLGGEHSITAGAIKAMVEHHHDLILVQLDAHADLRTDWLGSKYSHACTMTRCLEIMPSKKLFQVGIRSGTREEFLEIKKEKRLIVHQSGEQAKHLEKALKPFQGWPMYISIDLDWFDPSVLPGTGTPEPGGYFWNDFAAIINVLKDHKIVGGDIVELAPQLDPFGVSSIVAAKTTRSMIMLLNLRNGNNAYKK